MTNIVLSSALSAPCSEKKGLIGQYLPLHRENRDGSCFTSIQRLKASLQLCVLLHSYSAAERFQSPQQVSALLLHVLPIKVITAEVLITSIAH